MTHIRIIDNAGVEGDHNYSRVLCFWQIYELKDNHAQLMVHWLGGNTKVLICLARETPSGFEDKSHPPSPSGVFISFDYGDTFENKTGQFLLERNGTTFNTTLDGFSTHPKFNTVSTCSPHPLSSFLC